MTEGKTHELVALFRDGRFLEAAETLAERTGDVPSYRDLHNQAAAYYKAGRFERSVVCARAALHIEPQAMRTHYLLGLILRDAGHLEDAVRALNRACEIDPRSPTSLTARSVALFSLERVDEAITDLKAALELRPTDSLGYFNLGVMLVSKSRWNEAVEAFVKAVKIEPTTCEEYAHFLVDIGRVQVYQEVYGQGHRLKNMLGVLGDRFREHTANVSSRLSPKERDERSDIGNKLTLVFSDLNDFLSTARHQQLELDLVDLRELVEQVLVACSTNLSGVKVTRRFAAQLPEVVCDSGGIREVVLNLLLNATEAKPEGGRLTLSLTSHTDCVELRVADTGPGIPENLRDSVFRFGFSTKPFGSGLGLSQARRTVERHGGTLTLEANEPSGVIACMRLPVSPRVESGIEDIAIKPALSEDLRDLLVDAPEDEGLLV